MWCVMKSEDVEHYPKILEFLEWSHKENPDLVCFRHYIKMCTALKAKIIVNMLVKQHNLLNILKSLNEFFPENGLQYAQATRRDIKKLKLCFQQFRKLVLRMIRDESFRKQYIEVDLENEYVPASSHDNCEPNLIASSLEASLYQEVDQQRSGYYFQSKVNPIGVVQPVMCFVVVVVQGEDVYEYDEQFTSALEKLFWKYLESIFPPPKIEQVGTGLENHLENTEGCDQPCLLADVGALKNTIHKCFIVRQESHSIRLLKAAVLCFV
ncbi:UNVERIFIED_CONTAM: hypothetical protein FKN15_028920 [Acipenser sinensis]